MTQTNRDAQLTNLIQRVWDKVPAYRQKMEEAGVTPGNIKGVEDLHKLPFTTKGDLRDNYPMGLLACERDEIVRLHASSGTTGKPTVVAYTQKDLDTWSELMARSLEIAGVTKKDTVQVSYGYGLFTGGMGIHYGSERVGAAVIPASGGFSERQVVLMEDLGTTVLACTPSYALRLAELLPENHRETLSLRMGIFGAEPWSEELRAKLEERLGIVALDIYGLSEIMGPGVAMECPAQDGLHIHEDHFLLEVIDPDTGETLADGEEGELVITTLTKEALPMIRYRTRDITRIISEPCSCGHKGRRIARLRGRSDDMLIIRGVNVFPSQVEVALGGVPGLSLHYVLEVSEKEGLKELTVCCEAEEDLQGEALEKLRRKTLHELQGLLGVRVGLRILNPGSLERSEGKAQRIRKVA